MKPRIVTVNILETVTDEQFEDILSLFRIVEGVCGAELVRELPPIPKRPPQNGSGVPNHKPAATCPVCHGTCHVDANFYNLTKRKWSVPGGTVSCRSCNGKGYVVI